MTEVANPTLGKVQDALEIFALFAIMEVGLNALFVSVPWLATWPLRPFIRNMVEILAIKSFAALRMLIDLKAIKFVNDRHQFAYEREQSKLRALARTIGVDTDEFKKERENAKAAFAALVRFNGA